MKIVIPKTLSAVLVSILVLQLAGCGTILYPERRGQTRGDIDPGVAVLDGIGLLFFLIPGIAAYIVDFNTGAIYLPPGKSSEQRLRELKGSGLRLKEEKGRRVVYFDAGTMTPARFESTVRAVSGTGFSLDDPELEVYRFGQASKLHANFDRFDTGKEGSAQHFH